MADLPDETRDQIDAELFAGRKIQAIKLYRDATDVGLREAKDAVEAREAGLRVSAPERFATRAKGGCMTMIALILLPAVIATVWR